jgi:hypothetical protein
MHCLLPPPSRSLNTVIQPAVDHQWVTVSQTPLPALIVASFLDKPWTTNLIVETVITEKNPRGRPKIRASDPQLRQDGYLAELRKVESFVLLTNVPAERAPAREILCLYKGQKRVEDNFSVIKRPMMADMIYLKKPERIAALVTLLALSLLIQVVIRVLVRRNLDVLSTPPGLDHGCKPLIRPGFKKIFRFLGYFSGITIGGERRFRCISPDHEKNLVTWLRLLEFDVGM